jgi:trigger factor
MNVSVVDLSANQKKLQVEIPARTVSQELDKEYRELARKARIKGFRPGKVPRNILKSLYGKTIEGELSSRFIQESFPDALKEAELKPLVEADVDEMHFEDDGKFTYTAIIDVCPPFEVEGYKGLELKRAPIKVSEEQVDAELEKMRQNHSQLRSVEENRPARKDDMALIDFTPYVDDKEFTRGKGTDFMLEIGKHSIHPEFDEHLIGHETGETITFELDYPENAPTAEIAGRRVRFEVTIREIKEKVVPDLSDEFAREAGKHDSLEAMKEEIRGSLREREEARVSESVQKQAVDQLVDSVVFEISAKVVEREIDQMVRMLLYQFESQGLKVDGSRFNTPEVRNDYRIQAERTLRWRLIARQIARQEGLELTEEEIEQIYGDVARMARVDIERVRREYADSDIVQQSKEGRLQEKVLKLMEQEARFVEAPEEDAASTQE